MVNIKYRDCDFGKFEVFDDDGEFSFKVYTEIHAITLCEVLKGLYGRITYLDRVISKCIVNEKKYKCIISDKDEDIKCLEDEIKELNKIIRDLSVELNKFKRIYGLESF